MRFYASQQAFHQDVCYLKGETAGITGNHPKGIIQKTYGAKLVSANDASGFTYRGRFVTAEQAGGISYEASQKAHFALKWLIANQGVRVGDRTFVCWNPNGAPVPNLLGRHTDFEPDPDEENVPNTEPEYREWLKAVLSGYRGKLEPPHDDILILSLEAATPGRLSITYYAELKASDFLQKVEDWFSTCYWEYPFYKNGEFVKTKIKTPSFYEIVNCAYGTEREQPGDRAIMEVNDKILREQEQRLLNCMITNGRVPRDLVNAVFGSASNPLAYKKNYWRVRNTACALIAKFAAQPQAISEKGVNVRMDMDVLQKDRSYQFGRLLAVYEYVEQYALSKDEKNKGRQTSAVKLWQAYVNHPASTWKILEQQVNPYYLKIAIPCQKRPREAKEEIVEQLLQLNMEPEELDSGLSYLYLIGYYHQRAKLYKKKDQSDEETAAAQTDAE